MHHVHNLPRSCLAVEAVHACQCTMCCKVGLRHRAGLSLIRTHAFCHTTIRHEMSDHQLHCRPPSHGQSQQQIHPHICEQSSKLDAVRDDTVIEMLFQDQAADMPVPTGWLFETSSCSIADDHHTFAMRNSFSRQPLIPAYISNEMVTPLT